MRSAPVRHISMAVGILAAISLSAGGFGCSKEPAAPQPVVKRQAPKPEAKAPAAPAAEAPAKKVEAVALYDSRGRRDPFVSFIKAEERSKPGDAAFLPPLQRYDLGELKFVGVIWTKTGARGLVEDAEGKGYSVTVGTRIGRAGGVVSRITGKEILVKEEFVGNRGQKVVKESGIQLTTAGGK
jgi:Tfp pilus assembly protein PilP